MSFQGIPGVTTSSADCQQWINQGALDTFGFRREEAIRCFERALSMDKDCAMAHYFIAYNHAADYNNPDGMDYCTGYKEAQKALEIAQHSSISDWERALIEAQVHRFCWPVCSKPLEELNRDYANAMRPVYQRFGEDVNIAAFYAESLMMLAPWMLWTSPPNSKPAIQETEELVSVLEKALEKSPSHPGLCHYYIHAMELSDAPQKALPAAAELRCQYTQQGHLLHMPSHIDMWVGQYKEAVEANIQGVVADEAYRVKSGQDNEMYKMYRMHNYHFAVWASMFDGQYATAIRYAEDAQQQLGIEDVTCNVGDIPLGSMYLESFGSLPWHVLVRFGKWDAIINRPLKADKDAYAATVSTSHYARGIAFAVLGRLEEADAERIKFYDALQNKALEKRYLFNNVMHDPKHDGGILDVAEAVLNGEVEYHKGNFKEALKHLRLAVKRDISLSYDEPWGWMTPARQVLGALLLEHGGAAAEAESVYREDLKQYKENLWSLLGLYQALKQQQKTEEVVSVYTRFKKASARADVEIGASCLCATKMCQSY
jgi:tetratricopeptide (TPR) repeat protein